jgi:two-component sensor histidine kinase
VSIGWRGGRSKGLEIEWRERGGPPVSAPTARGFGSRLITDVPRGKMGAEVETRYDPEGLTWTLRSEPDGILS